jgi:CubicO group peptidase (beta-lactamase class C family)
MSGEAAHAAGDTFIFEINGNVVRGGVHGLLLFAVYWCGTPDSRAAGAQPVDEYVASEMRSQQIPGLSLAVLRDGQPVYVKSYGVATLEHLVPTKPDTLFQLGSVGKQFTSTAVMLLAREQRLDLDDPLSKYLPDIPPGWRSVTLRDMLKHQSGIPQLTPPARNLLDLHHDYTDDEYIRLATSLPLDFEPGTDASYSDTAYVLLGIVIGRITGGFYGDLLADRVFHPLGMMRTRIISDIDIIPDRASGYERAASGALQNQGWVAPALNRTADGSLYSTVLDLAKWDRALWAGTVLTHDELARAWTIDALKGGGTPLLHYGYGWEINSLRGHRVIEYDGNWEGFQSAVARYDDRGLTIMVLTNLSLCRVQRIVHTVAGYFDPVVAHFKQGTDDTRPTLTRRFRALLEEAQQGKLKPERLSPAAQSELSRVWLGALARDLRETGPIEEISFAEERSTSAGLERVYRVDTQEMVDFFTVRYTKDGRIDGVALYHEY